MQYLTNFVSWKSCFSRTWVYCREIAYLKMTAMSCLFSYISQFRPCISDRFTKTEILNGNLPERLSSRLVIKRITLIFVDLKCIMNFSAFYQLPNTFGIKMTSSKLRGWGVPLFSRSRVYRRTGRGKVGCPEPKQILQVCFVGYAVATFISHSLPCLGSAIRRSARV